MKRLEVDFCISALNEVLNIARPQIFNSDQGIQYTSKRFMQINNIKIIMDRVFNNILTERL